MILTISGALAIRLLMGLAVLLCAVFAAGAFVGEQLALGWRLRGAQKNGSNQCDPVEGDPGHPRSAEPVGEGGACDDGPRAVAVAGRRGRLVRPPHHGRTLRAWNLDHLR